MCDCFHQVLNESDGTELLFADGVRSFAMENLRWNPMRLELTSFSSSQLNVRYHMAQMKVCDKLDVYETRPQKHTYQGAWFLNTNVPEGRRQAINREIADMRMDEAVKGILDDFFSEVVPATCGQPTPPKIDGEVLGPFFAIMLGPLVVAVVVSLMWGFVLEHLAIHNFEH